MLVIDTYNVLGVTGVLPPEMADLDVPGLAQRLRSGRHARDPALLVCDGTPPGKSWSPRGGLRLDALEGVRVVYAGPGREADTLIEQILADSSAARRMTVVSNDRRVQRAARRQRAGVLSSDAFLRGLAADARRAGPAPYPAFAKAIPLAEDRVASWLRTFDLGPEFVEELARATGQDPARVERQLWAIRDHAEAVETTGGVDAEGGPAPEGPEPEAGASGALSARSPTGPGEDDEPVDPLLLEALEEWRGRLSLDDLDMERWLGESE